MRIVFVGGGTGGHFYPLIAVAEAIEDLVKERTLIDPELIYLGPKPFDNTALIEHNIDYIPSPAGKLRRYPSILNVLSVFPITIGIIRSVFLLFRLYPDVIFSTGGYAAFPTLWAARLLRIPIVIYDADAKPGRVSLWSAKFAKWIGVAHPEAAANFPEKLRYKIARTGHPIRKEIESPTPEGGAEFLKIDPSLKTIFVMGGSQGAQAINEAVLDALPELLQKYNVVHQAGAANAEEVSRIAGVILKDNSQADRYKVFGLLNTLAMRMAAGASSLIVARAGSGTIFEVASWGIPSIVVPIPLEISHDQTENAFSYARTDAAVVIEQRNLTPHVLVAEIDRIIQDPALQERMKQAAKAYARPHAARKIATTLIEIGLQHETP